MTSMILCVAVIVLPTVMTAKLLMQGFCHGLKEPVIESFDLSDENTPDYLFNLINFSDLMFPSLS